MELFSGEATQAGIAKKLGISLSTVNNALKPLQRIGAIEKMRFGFRLVDREKALVFFATARNLEKDVVFSTRADLGALEIEKLMPAGIVFTAYSAFRLRFGEVPADYSEVYVYAGEEELVELKKRFPARSGPPNITALAGGELFKQEKIASNELVFADLWNLKEWYAKEFIKALEQKMGI